MLSLYNSELASVHVWSQTHTNVHVCTRNDLSDGSQTRMNIYIIQYCGRKGLCPEGRIGLRVTNTGTLVCAPLVTIASAPTVRTSACPPTVQTWINGQTSMFTNVFERLYNFYIFGTQCFAMALGWQSASTVALPVARWIECVNINNHVCI